MSTFEGEAGLLIRRDVLRRQLILLNLSMDEFKASSGVDRRTLERILSGKTRRPHPATVERICAAAKLSLRQLFAHSNHFIDDPIDSDQFTPFAVGSAVPHPEYFHGRQFIVRKLVSLWRSAPMQNAAVIGNSGMGKTSLFRYLIRVSDPLYALNTDRHLANREILVDIRWLYLDLSNPTITSAGRLHSLILQYFDPSFCQSEVGTIEFFDRMGSIAMLGKTVIVFDEIDVALGRAASAPHALDNRFWEGMRYLSTLHPDNMAFLLGSKLTPFSYASVFDMSSPFFNIFGYTTELRPLEIDEASSMFSTSTHAFSADDSNWIIESSGCFPRLLQLFCWELLTTLIDQSYTPSWRKGALEKAALLPEFERV